MTGTSAMAGASVLHGRIAVVTGAARGLGAAVARALATRGARVALLGLEEEELARVAASLPAGSAVYRQVDVTDDGGMAAAAEWVGHRLGTPSVVVANAGVAEAGPFVGVGIAYLSWAETGMTEEADAHGALRRIKAGMPWPVSRVPDGAVIGFGELLDAGSDSGVTIRTSCRFT